MNDGWTPKLQPTLRTPWREFSVQINDELVNGKSRDEGMRNWCVNRA